jgi:hypothetical protein
MGHKRFVMNAPLGDGINYPCVDRLQPEDVFIIRHAYGLVNELLGVVIFLDLTCKFEVSLIAIQGCVARSTLLTSSNH